MGGRIRKCSSFIKIKYGENEESIFNPDCSLKLLVDSIRGKCDCPPLELAVAEEGETLSGDVTITVTELPENMDNGRPYFNDRGSYVLLSILRREGHSEYESLLDEEHMSQELKDKIHLLNNPKAAERRPSRISRAKPPSRKDLMGSRGSRRSTLAPIGLKGKKTLI